MDASTHRPCRCIDRCGISTLEFIACFSAMVGGAVLGSLYLGVDVTGLAHAALERAQLVDPQSGSTDAAPSPKAAARTITVTEASPHDSTASATTIDDNAAAEGTPAEPDNEADQPVEASREAPKAPIADLFAGEKLLTDQQRLELTGAYWGGLSSCMDEESKHRASAAVEADGNWLLFDYLTHRKEAHRQAAELITALDLHGVDAHVAAYAKACLAWQTDGARLFGRALDLLTDAPSAQLSGPFGQSWQSAATQHRMEERLLNEKRRAVQQYLDHLQQADTEPAAK